MSDGLFVHSHNVLIGMIEKVPPCRLFLAGEWWMVGVTFPTFRMDSNLRRPWRSRRLETRRADVDASCWDGYEIILAWNRENAVRSFASTLSRCWSLNIILNVLIFSLSFTHCSTQKGAGSARRLFEFSVSFKFQWGDRYIVPSDGKEADLLVTAISINLAIFLSSWYEESAFTFWISESYHFISGYEAGCHEGGFDFLRIARRMFGRGDVICVGNWLILPQFRRIKPRLQIEASFRLLPVTCSWVIHDSFFSSIAILSLPDVIRHEN
jgi:hypothetical protein